MDLIATLYYAMICAALAYVSGGLRRVRGRVLVGAIVGLVAAAALPYLRSALGV